MATDFEFFEGAERNGGASTRRRQFDQVSTRSIATPGNSSPCFRRKLEDFGTSSKSLQYPPSSLIR
jgi:hypothetical protein